MKNGFLDPLITQQFYLNLFNVSLMHVSLFLCKCCKQFQHYKDEMFLQAQRAFSVSPERHYRLLHAAAEEKPRIIVLNVLVQAADNLEAKDANGKYILLRTVLKRVILKGFIPSMVFRFRVSFHL